MRRLIIRPGAIGDFIVSLPAMEALRAEYTEVWTAGVNVPLARFADRARSITATGLDRLGIVEAGDVIEQLRQFDSIVSWYGTNRPEFRDLVEKLRLPFQFHRSLPVLAQTSACHATDFFLHQVGANPGAIPQIQVPPIARENRIVIHPFSGSPKKNWPLPRFHELARRLQSKAPVEWCRGLEDNLPGALLIPNLYDLACHLRSASLFIGNDSGISHLAAAVNTPVLALFGPSDPAIWAPRGPTVRIIARPEMSGITVNEVMDAIR